MKVMRKVLCFVVAVAMVTALMAGTVEAAAKVKLNKKKVTLTITDSKKRPATTLKIKGLSKKKAKKAKWYTSKKSVATVKKGRVTAKKAGKATITCKVKGKKYKCKVTVVDKRTDNERADSNALDITIIQKASETGLGPDFPRNIEPTLGYQDKPITPYPCAGTGGDPYGVNKIKVTYNGKDVTNEARYEIDEPQVASVTSPGVIEVTNRGMLFKLTVSYKGAEKTFRMGKTTVPYTYIMCYCCGAVFPYDNMSQFSDHWKDETNDCMGGFWFVRYLQYIDIRIKG